MKPPFKKKKASENDAANERETSATPATESTGTSSDAFRKKLGKRPTIIAAVVAAVIAVAGAGFWSWHETPSFCGAICHTPMDPYLNTYEQEPNTVGIDKWGNEIKDTSALLAVSHRTNESEATCLDCHTPTLSEQASEGISWVAGDYEVKANDTYGVALTEKSLSDLTAASGAEPESFCLNEACHTNADSTTMTWDDLAKLTADQKYNPHVNQHGNVTCSDCHKAHRASVNQCSGCHAEASIPDGWLSIAQEKRLNG